MNKPFSPNHIPTAERVTNTLFAVFLLSYGGYGVWVNDLIIPGKHGSGLHLHGLTAWVMFAALICASLVLLTVVADHYDKRDNEINYKRFADLFRVIGWNLFAVSLIIGVIRFVRG